MWCNGSGTTAGEGRSIWAQEEMRGCDWTTCLLWLVTDPSEMTDSQDGLVTRKPVAGESPFASCTLSVRSSSSSGWCLLPYDTKPAAKISCGSDLGTAFPFACCAALRHGLTLRATGAIIWMLWLRHSDIPPSIAASICLYDDIPRACSPFTCKELVWSLLGQNLTRLTAPGQVLRCGAFPCAILCCCNSWAVVQVLPFKSPLTPLCTFFCSLWPSCARCKFLSMKPIPSKELFELWNSWPLKSFGDGCDGNTFWIPESQISFVATGFSSWVLLCKPCGSEEDDNFKGCGGLSEPPLRTVSTAAWHNCQFPVPSSPTAPNTGFTVLPQAS